MELYVADHAARVGGAARQEEHVRCWFQARVRWRFLPLVPRPPRVCAAARVRAAQRLDDPQAALEGHVLAHACACGPLPLLRVRSSFTPNRIASWSRLPSMTSWRRRSRSALRSSSAARSASSAIRRRRRIARGRRRRRATRSLLTPRYCSLTLSDRTMRTLRRALAALCSTQRSTMRVAASAVLATTSRRRERAAARGEEGGRCRVAARKVEALRSPRRCALVRADRERGGIAPQPRVASAAERVRPRQQSGGCRSEGAGQPRTAARRPRAGRARAHSIADCV